MSRGLRNVLDILAELAHNDTEADVFESNLVSKSGVPKSEVQIYLKRIRVSVPRRGSTT